MKCPLCLNNETKLIKTIDSGNFDKSILYDKIRIRSCVFCGHIFNELTITEKQNLYEYYISEYAHTHYITFENEFIDSDSDILEITQKHLNHYLNALYNFKLKKTYKTIILDQFIEHVIDLSTLFIEITLNLEFGGILKISCPNSLEYMNDKLHFQDYNFLIREHIHHFDRTHLIYLANIFGFELVNETYNEIEIIKGVDMPNMILTFKYTGKIKYVFNGIFDLKNLIENSPNKGIINILNTYHYCYGIGREFLYMKRNDLVYNCVGLIDNTPIKKQYTVDGMKIYNDDIIKELTRYSTILITAFAHKDTITKKLRDLNYKGNII
jgi:hypothetical protein